MAELEKKLHLLKSDLTQEDITLYSTSAEVGDKYLSIKVPAYTKYYKWIDWVQPVLTSTTSYGTVTASSYNTNYPGSIYWALDGIDTTRWEVGKSTYSGWWKWELPLKIRIKGISFLSKTNDKPNLTCRFYTDSTMTIPIGDVATVNAINTTTVISNIPEEGIITDTIYIDCTATNDYFGISEITIDAEYAVESTIDDYDYTEEVPETTAYIGLGKIKYYNVTNWVQPVFTSNTGPNGEVVSSTYTESTHYAYKAMDGIKLISNDSSDFNGYKWYSTWTLTLPYYITITGLVHYNRYYTSRSHLTGRFYADLEKTIPIGNSFSTPDSSWYKTTIAGIPSEGIYTNTIYFVKTAGDDYNGIGELEITATRAIETTKDASNLTVLPLNNSSLSVIKSGVDYKVLKISRPDYTEVDFTTAGTYTWTVPEGVTKVRVAMVGGAGSLYTYEDDPSGS